MKAQVRKWRYGDGLVLANYVVERYSKLAEARRASEQMSAEDEECEAERWGLTSATVTQYIAERVGDDPAYIRRDDWRTTHPSTWNIHPDAAFASA